MPQFDDFFGEGDFLILEEEDYATPNGEAWDTGAPTDIFATGEAQDIFNTNNQ